jgi:hypothetical protein
MAGVTEHQEMPHSPVTLSCLPGRRADAKVSTRLASCRATAGDRTDSVPACNRTKIQAQDDYAQPDDLQPCPIADMQRGKVQATAARCARYVVDVMPTQRWSDLCERTRGLLMTAAVADDALRVAALVDIKRRPASQIRGRKRVWAAAVALVSSAGVLSTSYFVFGRRRQP